jgi:hypothetical protein
MDQHDFRLSRFQGFEPSPHRRLARGAPRNGGEDVHTVSQHAYQGEVVRPYHCLYEGNRGNVGEGGEGALEQCIAADAAKLLGKIATRPNALAGGYNDGCNTRHLLLLDVAQL